MVLAWVFFVFGENVNLYGSHEAKSMVTPSIRLEVMFP